jgi:hypothetical protein
MDKDSETLPESQSLKRIPIPMGSRTHFHCYPLKEAIFAPQ